MMNSITHVEARKYQGKVNKKNKILQKIHLSDSNPSIIIGFAYNIINLGLSIEIK